MIKAIIFDFFGVVCSDEYWQFVKADRQTDSVFREYADEVNSGEIDWKAFVEKIAAVTKTSAEEVGKMYESEHIDPRIVALIDSLRGKYKTALLTNAHHDFIDEILKKNHLRGLFDGVFVSSRLGVVKPDPRIFGHALNSLGIEPMEAVYIDDMERHVSSAAEVGMRAILYKDFAQMKRDLDKILADS